MSVQQEETGAPITRPHQDGSGNDDGRAGSSLRNRVFANNIYAIHGLLLSGIELALTVGNALKQDAFQLNSFSDVIFGGSVVIEAVGFVFAIAMALRILLYPEGQGVIGVGVPAMVIVEALVVEGSVRDMSMFGFVGLGVQSACFLLFAIISTFQLPDWTQHIVFVWVAFLPVLFLLVFHVVLQHIRNDHSTTDVVYSIFWAVPFAVEVAESALIFTSDSVSFVAYILAVLDLVIIAPAACLILVSVAAFLMRLFDGV